MHSSLTAVVLCIFMHAAGAQCPTSAPASDDTHELAELAKTKPTLTPSAGAGRQSATLIKTAAAGTHAAVAMGHPARLMEKPAEGPPRRGGSAMLLAALALMSGIALRRYGADKR